MSFKFETIDHVQLAAPKGSEEEARRFFKGILGFEEIEKPYDLKKRGGAWFEYGTIQIHIGIEEPFIPAKKAHPAFQVVNLDALKKHFMDEGIEFTVDENLPGADRVYVNDPFGNRIEILEWVK